MVVGFSLVVLLPSGDTETLLCLPPTPAEVVGGVYRFKSPIEEEPAAIPSKLFKPVGGSRGSTQRAHK